MTKPSAVVILAAGKGTRMKSGLPKVLHPIGQAPMLHHAMRVAEALSPEVTVVVVGHGADKVESAARAWNPSTIVARQTEQLGTGHAVQSAHDALHEFDGDLYVLFGDTPFIQPETLVAMQSARASADFVALGFDAANPGKYGRFILGDEDALLAIVEAKDASPKELEISICNSGLMGGDCRTILDLLGQVRNDNAQGEYYLTDVIALAQSKNLICRAVMCDEAETLGINDRVQLAEAETIFQDRARVHAMREGATLTAPETVFFAMDTKLGRDVLVHPNVVFGPGVIVGDDCEIKAFSHLEETILARDVKVGPFARMRGGNDLASGVRVGNFVELKNASLGEGTKAGHLSYLGDALLGSRVNIGAGTITCNYDGFSKFRTDIGDDAFIGVQTALIAPIHVGDGAYVGTGTTLTKDVPEDALATSRVLQRNRPGFASRLREKFAGRKAHSQKKDG